MIPKCYMLLCSCIYVLEHYGQLPIMLPVSFFFCNSEYKIDKHRCYCCFQLGWLNDHLFMKKLFIRSTVCVFCKRL